MSAAKRVRLIVGLLALLAAGVVVGVVYATRQAPPQPSAQCKGRPRALIVPGVDSPNVGAVRAAFAHDPKTAARELEPLAQAAPADPVVQFNFAAVLFCAGYVGDAEQAWRAAKKGGRDTYYEMKSDMILHPQFFTPIDGLYPVFEPQGNDPLLLQGVVQQRQGHQHSAERLYARAARLRPGSDEAQVAAAVGLFDEDNLSASFSHLGPLVKRFPRSQSVRFHLGLLLAWTGQRAQATTEFRLARAVGPTTRLGREADMFLRGLVTGGTKRTQR
ncbi:MAG: tetratricopeptide repeat protein [Gaiellaceae bacterium]